MGGQASDQASERGARPVPARSSGQVNAKTPRTGVSKTRSHERARSRTSLAIAPDGTLSLSQQDLTPIPRWRHLGRAGQVSAILQAPVVVYLAYSLAASSCARRL